MSDVQVSGDRKLGRWLPSAVAVLVAVAVVAAAVTYQAGVPPLPGRIESDPTTGAVAAFLGLVAQLAALGCVGSLLVAALFSTRGRGERGNAVLPQALDPAGLAGLVAARRWAMVWSCAALILVPFNAADTNGVPIGYVLSPALPDFLSATQTAQAWLLTAVVALGIALVGLVGRTWRVSFALLVLAVGVAVPTVITAQVSVGSDHDLATDAATLFTLVTALWFGSAWALNRCSVGQPTEAAVARRYRHLGLLAVVVAIPARIGIAAFELAGQRPWKSLYGLLVCLLMVILVGLTVRLVVQALSRGRDRLRGVRWDLALMIVIIGIQVALVHLPPPKFSQPQSIVQNLLGFELPDPPTLATMLQPGRPNLMLTAIAATAVVLYVWGVVRLRRRGDSWPAGRLVAWLAGWLVVLTISTSRVWSYSSGTFSWHMLVHMTLNMLVPVLLVLSGPITLALRACTATPAGGLPGVRDGITAMLNWRFVQRLTHPLLIWVVFVGSFYALYFSSLFGSAMKYHWAHQLMTVHFLVIGCLFYGLAVGIDRPPRPLPHIARLGFVFAAMPFHAFFAVGVLSGNSIIGQNFYEFLDLPWMQDLAADQQTGGQIAWATGELPLLVVIIALLAQWFRQDQRTARRSDRAQDSGTDDSLEAYNAMLAELSEREEKRSLRP